MAKIHRTVCDECRDVDRPTKRYRVSTVGGEEETATVDLCAEHGAPLNRILEHHAGQLKRRTFETSVVTLAEIERRKAARP